MPPFSATAPAVLSASSLAMYIVQAVGAPGWEGPTPAAAVSPTAAMVYPPYSSSVSWNSQPMTAV